MNSLKSVVLTHEEQQAVLRAQIAALQSQLDPNVDVPQVDAKENRQGKRILVSASPSKSPVKKRRIDSGTSVLRVQRASSSSSRPHEPVKPAAPPPVVPPPIRTSNVFGALQQMNGAPTVRDEEAVIETAARSTAFDEPAVPRTAPVRDDSLALVESLEPGPREHRPLPDDPRFEKTEPNSGIRLSSRKVSHAEVQKYLTDRFLLQPSLLYSVVRLTPDKQAYDVPVFGDWVTVAVVAERSEVRISRGGGGTHEDSDHEGEDSKKNGQGWKKKAEQQEQQERKPSGKKFITFKLVDFGMRSAGTATSSNKGGTSRGDALLSLLLFEANTALEEEVVDEDGQRKKKTTYKGGSGGAFETWASVLREGSVIALLNPRILRPFQKDIAKPHPTDNVLALTPGSASSIVVLGQSQDLGQCAARRKDGKQCTGWCDKRVNDICGYHIQQRVKSLRAARPEFSAGTSGISSVRTIKGRASSAPDYAKKQGLLPPKQTGPIAAPRDSGGGPTYIMEGRVVRSGGGRLLGAPSTQEFVSEKLGRDRAQRDLRKGKSRKVEQELVSMLGSRTDTTKLTIHGSRIMRASDPSKAGGEEEEEKVAAAKSAFTAATVKKIGFNPAVVASRASTEAARKEAKDRNLQALLDRRNLKEEPKLKGPPGQPKIRSGVSVPAHVDAEARSREPAVLSDPESDSEIFRDVPMEPASAVAMTREDESSDLEIDGLEAGVDIPIKRKVVS